MRLSESGNREWPGIDRSWAWSTPFNPGRQFVYFFMARPRLRSTRLTVPSNFACPLPVIIDRDHGEHALGFVPNRTVTLLCQRHKLIRTTLDECPECSHSLIPTTAVNYLDEICDVATNRASPPQRNDCKFHHHCVSPRQLVEASSIIDGLVLCVRL